MTLKHWEQLLAYLAARFRDAGIARVDAELYALHLARCAVLAP